jgi:hypothetical protein
MPKQTTLEYWSERAEKALVGRTIVGARYLTKDEVEGLGWTQSVLVMQLDDGTLLYPSMDDEGNNGGAMFGNKGKEELGFPVVRDYLMDRERPSVSQKPTPQDPRSKRSDATLTRLLKKIQGGKTELHYGNKASLEQLKEQGHIARMARVNRGRVPYFRVELTEKGKAA